MPQMTSEGCWSAKRMSAPHQSTHHQQRLARATRRILPALALLSLGCSLPVFADSVSITSTVSNVSGSQYEYTYNVTGSLTSGDLLAIYFPAATSANIVDASSSSTDVTTSVLQADNSIPADGEYDITANTDIANYLGSFDVLFNYSGTGTPTAQNFTLYDASFAPVESGTTSTGAAAVTPEPASWALMLTGLCFFLTAGWANRNKSIARSSAAIGALVLVFALPLHSYAQGGGTPPTGGGGTPPTGGGGTGGGGTGGGGSAVTGLNIGAYTLLSSYRASTYDYYYKYTTTVSNTNSTPYTYVQGTVTSSNANTTVIAGAVEFGLVPASGSASGLNVLTIRQDRRYAFDPSSLSWTFTGQTSTTVGTTPTTVSINASPTSASYGTGINLSATVSPAASTGTVTFYDGPVPLGAATLSAGAASMTGFVLPTGSHDLTAVYSGDATYAVGSSSHDPATITAAGAVTNCSGLQESPLVTCLAQAFEATLTAAQISTLQLSYALTNAEHWSNLPISIIARNGLALGTLTSTQLAAALQLAQAAMSAQGYQRLRDIRGADTILNSYNAEMEFGPGNYYVAFIGTPSASSPWQLQFAGHHFAFNHTFNGKYVSATPYFLGTEPTIYSVAGTQYTPLQGPNDAAYNLTRSVYGNSTALLNGSFDDVVMGVDSSTHIDSDYPQTYPTTGRGVLYTSLTSAQQAQVKSMIEAWVNDMDATTAASLLGTYEDANALANTYVGYSGTGTLAQQGDYIRVDGPRVWIEFVVQSGIVFTASYHFHTIWRDKTADYGGDFSSN